MKKESQKYLKILTFFTLLILSPVSIAIDSWGEINDTYSYDDLKIIENSNGTCTTTGKIINKTNELKDGVYIKMYGYDMFDKFEWSTILFFSVIPEKDEVKFSETILKCTEDNPYKIDFKVTD